MEKKMKKDTKLNVKKIVFGDYDEFTAEDKNGIIHKCSGYMSQMYVDGLYTDYVLNNSILVFKEPVEMFFNEYMEHIEPLPPAAPNPLLGFDIDNYKGDQLDVDR